MISVIALLLGLVCQQVAASRSPDFHVGARYRAELQTPFSGSWSNVPLRELLAKVAAERRLAILLDRRIDPTVRVPLEIANQSLTDGLQDLAGRAGVTLSPTPNVLYLGPATAAARLRTLIEIRTTEWTAAEPAAERRTGAMPRRLTIAWDDLTAPRDILTDIAERFRIRIENLDTIPHDLWAAATLPEVTAVEALSLVLIQFDLTFRRESDGQTIVLVPAPAEPVVERRLRMKGRTASDLARQLTETFPDLQPRMSGVDVLVAASVEVHEEIAAWMNPSTARPAPAVAAPTPLRQRTFTLTFRRVPVADVMKKLEQSGIVFEYDQDAFRTAGIDWSQTVDMDLEKAPADQFLKRLFAAYPVSFEIDRVTVRLRLTQ